MLTYHVILLDKDGTPEYAQIIEGGDDDEALDRTARLHHKYEMRVYLDDRLIGRFLPKSDREFWRAPARPAAL